MWGKTLHRQHRAQAQLQQQNQPQKHPLLLQPLKQQPLKALQHPPQQVKPLLQYLLPPQVKPPLLPLLLNRQHLPLQQVALQKVALVKNFHYVKAHLALFLRLMLYKTTPLMHLNRMWLIFVCLLHWIFQVKICEFIVLDAVKMSACFYSGFFLLRYLGPQKDDVDAVGMYIESFCSTYE